MSSAVTVMVALSALATPLAKAVAGPALLFEAGSGKILYAEDQDDLWHPASLTKIMTAYLVFGAIKDGRLKADGTIKVSDVAHGQPPSKVGLPVGAEMTVDVAIRALIIKSANDVAVMLAEAVGGSEERFVALMNDTARRLGMTKTRFVNPHGLPAAEQVTTARDLARLARALLRDFPQYMPLWGMSDMQIGKLTLHSHNGLLKSFEGADGIKTGFICDSGFNVVASATRDGRKLVAVVLGEVSGRERNVRAASLLEHGFQVYDWKQIFNSSTVESLPVKADAKGVISIRKSIVAWSCNPPPKAVATGKRKGKGQAVAKRAKAPAKAKAVAPSKTKAAASRKAGEKVTRRERPVPAKSPAPPKPKDSVAAKSQAKSP